MTTIAIIGMGAIGAGIAARLVRNGARVVTTLEGRSAASAGRARAAGVEAMDRDEMIGQADMIVSIIPPARAAETASLFATRIAAAERRPVFIDANAIAPATARAIAARFSEAGLAFGDASIIGRPPREEDAGPRFYMSGPVAEQAATLKRLGLDARPFSEAIGEASALKMAYAGITKGFQALGTAMILGAARNGVSDSFTAELRDSQPQLAAWLTRQLPTMYDKAYRWDGEMREIAAFLMPEQPSSDMLTGAADLYQRVAKDNAEGPDSEIVSTLERFVNAGK